MVADLRRHVADQRLEHRLLAVEVSVEGAERDAGALVIPTIEPSENPRSPNSSQRRVEDLAQGPLAARGARRLAVARRADRARLRSHSASAMRSIAQYAPLSRRNSCQVESRFKFHYDRESGRRGNQACRGQNRGDELP